MLFDYVDQPLRPSQGAYGLALLTSFAGGRGPHIPIYEGVGTSPIMGGIEKLILSLKEVFNSKTNRGKNK